MNLSYNISATAERSVDVEEVFPSAAVVGEQVAVRRVDTRRRKKN